MELFIPGTYKRHSIDDKGVVYSNYRKLKNGKIIYRRRIVPKYMNSQIVLSPCVAIFTGKKCKKKTLFVNSVMVKLFKIKEPDKYHFYDIIPKNGDSYNNGVENIGFRIRMEKYSNYKFYPQPSYNKRGRITHKICGDCGENKIIKYFILQSHTKPGLHKTYRNLCTKCIGLRQWKNIKANPERHKRVKEQCSKWSKTEKAIEYHKSYRKIYIKQSHDNISHHYISSSLKLNTIGLKSKDLTDEMIKIARKKIILFRNVKQLKLRLNGTN